MKLGFYKHYKGNYYEVMGVVTHKSKSKKIDGKEMVLYRDTITGKQHTRLKDDFEETIFLDGKIPVNRFTYICADAKDIPTDVSDIPPKPKGEIIYG